MQNLRIFHLLLIFIQLLQMQCKTNMCSLNWVIKHWRVVWFRILINFLGMKELVCSQESEQELNFALRGPIDHYGWSSMIWKSKPLKFLMQCNKTTGHYGKVLLINIILIPSAKIRKEWKNGRGEKTEMYMDFPSPAWLQGQSFNWCEKYCKRLTLASRLCSAS